MNVKVAKNIGFCPGVKAAVDTCERECERGDYILGEIVHNKRVVDDFESRGFIRCDDISDVPDGATVVFRSHGVTKQTYEICSSRGIKVIDCTCPNIKKTQKIIEEQCAQGRRAVIVGYPDHPEVTGLLGWCQEGASVVSKREDVTEKTVEGDFFVVAQTTVTPEFYGEIIQCMQNLCGKKVVYFDTICYTTIERQRECADLASSCDAIVVVGGEESSNTKALAEVARRHCENVFWAGDESPFDGNIVKNFLNVGVVSGASTPSEQTREVLSSMADEEKVSEAEEVKDDEQAAEVVAEDVTEVAQSATEEVEKAETVEEDKAEEAEEDKAEETEAASEEPAKPAKASGRKKGTTKKAKEVDDSNPMAAVLDQLDTRLPKTGSTITVSIVGVNDDGLLFCMPPEYNRFKKELPLLKEELIDGANYKAADYKKLIGTDMDVVVTYSHEDEKSGDCFISVSQKALKAREEEEKFLAEINDGKTEFTIEIKDTNKGGLVGYLHNFQVFVPSSQIRLGRTNPEEFEKYKGKTLKVRCLEVKNDSKTREIVASARVILEEERAARDAEKAAKAAAFFDNYSVGDIVEGKVERIRDFGAFVSVNDYDCLVRIGEMSWSRLSKKDIPKIFEIGKTYRFVVLSADRDTGRVQLGYRQLQPQPWDDVPEKLHVGDVVTGTVVRLMDYGAFVQLLPDVDALLHISQISYDRVDKPGDVLKVGQQIEVKISSIDSVMRKINVSMKALQPRPEQTSERKSEKRDDGDRPKRKSSRRERQNVEEDEYVSWHEGSIEGASIGDLIANAEKDKKK